MPELKMQKINAGVSPFYIDMTRGRRAWMAALFTRGRRVRETERETGRETASLSLEAAIVLPLLLAVFLQLGLSLYAVAAELDVNAALFRLGKEANLMLTGERFWENLEYERRPAHTLEKNAADRSLFMRVLSDAGLSHLTAPLAESRLAAWFAGLHEQETRFQLIRDGRFFIEKPRAATMGRLHFYYLIPGLWESVPRSSTQLISDWSGRGESSKVEKEEALDGQGDHLWALDNLSRGKAFQSRYGANLSEFHPVVAKADGRGGVSMIKSIDLTKDSYRETGVLDRKLTDCLDELQSFSGTDESGPVFSRELLVVVPENSPADAWQALNLRQGEAALRGIRLTLVRDGRSD